MAKIHKTVFWILFFLLLFTIDLDSSFHYMDYDFGWHLKVGEEILSTKEAPSINVDNYTLLNRNWVDHEWAFNALIALAFNWLGYIGVSIFFALLVLLLFALLYFHVARFSSRNSASHYYLPPLFILGLLAMSPHLGVRVQEIALIYVAALIIIIRFFEQGKTKALIFMPFLFFLWANTHGTFILGFAIIFAWVVARLSWFYVRKWPFFNAFSDPIRLDRKKYAIFYTSTLFSVLFTFINPYGFKLYEFLFGYTDTYYLTHVVEWTPIYYFPIQYWQIFFAALVASSFVLWFMSDRAALSENVYASANGATPESSSGQALSDPKPKLRADLWEIGLILVFFILTIKSKRNFPIFYVLSLPFLVKQAVDLLPVNPKLQEMIGSRQGMIIKSYIYLCLALVIIGKIASTPFTNRPFESYCGVYPCGAVDYLKKHQEYDSLNLYNEYGWGGFLLRMLPGRKLFIDGRFPQIKYLNTSILEEYYEFYKEEKTAEKLREHDIGIILLETITERIKLNWLEKHFFLLNETAVNKNENKLKDYLDKSPDWKIVYEDEVSTIYLNSQKTPRNIEPK